MKIVKNLLAGLLINMVSLVPTQAQNPGSVALGVRATPDGGGFTAKFYLDRYFAIETQLNGSGGSYYYNNNTNGPSVSLVGLAEFHVILPDPSWRIFAGPGLHFGTWDRYNDGNTQGIFGLDGILGVEYIFKTAPFGISADVKPSINLTQDAVFFPNNVFGASARYYIGYSRPRHHMPPPVERRY